MKFLPVIVVLVICYSCEAQQITYDNFKADAKNQINLQPKYGNLSKSSEQIAVDQGRRIKNLIR